MEKLTDKSATWVRTFIRGAIDQIDFINGIDSRYEVEFTVQEYASWFYIEFKWIIGRTKSQTGDPAYTPDVKPIIETHTVIVLKAESISKLVREINDAIDIVTAKPYHEEVEPENV